MGSSWVGKTIFNDVTRNYSLRPPLAAVTHHIHIEWAPLQVTTASPAVVRTPVIPKHISRAGPTPSGATFSSKSLTS